MFLFSVLCFCENARAGFSFQNMTFQLDAPNLWKWNATNGGTLDRGGCLTMASAGNTGDVVIGKTQGYVEDPEYRGDEYGIMVMVARETSEGGARFCPMVINAYNRNKKCKTTQYYHELTPCVWLCHKGYTGDRCSEVESAVSSCDTSELRKSNYAGLSTVSRDKATNIKNKIPNYWSDQGNGDSSAGVHNCKGTPDFRDPCSESRTQVEWVLVIHNWLPSGHGAWVRPYEITANWFEKNHTRVEAYPAENSYPVLGCKNGYRPNAANNDCEPIDVTKCVGTWCPGWDQSKYDGNKHYAIQVGDCLQWRCKESGYDLKPDGSGECVRRSSNTTNSSGNTTVTSGTSETDGTTLNCDSDDGKIFYKGNCVSISEYFYTVGKPQMLYGAGSARDDFDKQCWTKSNSAEYKECVMAGVPD